MPRPTASAAAEDIVAVVGAYADRLHDLLLRQGLRPSAAARVVQDTARRLVAATAEGRVRDVLGWWWGAALTRAAESGSTPSTTVRGRDPVEAALLDLPERLRLPVLLRDDDDLPLSSVAVALGLDEQTAAVRVLEARRAVTAAHDRTTAAALPRHAQGDDVSPRALAGLADGSLDAAESARARQHVRACAACSAAVDEAQRGRRLVAALPVRPLSDSAREALMQELMVTAQQELPTAAALTAARESAASRRVPLVTGRVVAAVIVGALVVGALIGALLSSGGGDRGTPASLASPSASATAAAPAPSATASSRPSGSPTPKPSATPRRTPRPTVSRTARPSPTPTPNAASRPPATTASIALDPPTGPNDTAVTVTGQGFGPGTLVDVAYQDSLGRTQSTATATADGNGRFVAQVVAHDPLALPGRHTVIASDGAHRASATFQAT